MTPCARCGTHTRHLYTFGLRDVFGICGLDCFDAMYSILQEMGVYR